MSFNSTPIELVEQNINGLLSIHDSWQRVSMDFIAEITNGFAFKSSGFNTEKMGSPLIRIRDVLKGKTSTYYSGEVPSGYWVYPGDLIVGMDGDFNSTIWRSEPALLNQRVCKVDVSEEKYSKKFFFYTLPGYLSAININTSSVTVKHLSSRTLQETLLPLPPLAEQKFIAEKLDTLLAQVDSSKARLEKIPMILKRFRQALMAAAVSGHLTEEWRNKNCNLDIHNISVGNYKPNDVLFEQAKLSVPEIPSSWQIIPSAHLIEYITSGSRGWANYYSSEGALFLRMSNVRYNTTKLDLDDLQFVNLPGSVEGKRSLVKVDDLIISLTADVGRVARIDKDLGEAYINQHLALVRPTKNIESEYFALCIASQNIGVKQIQFFKKGATKAGLGLDDIRSLAIPFPPLSEQQEIVRRVEQLLAYADTIEKQVNNALTRANNLTQSILAKAFRGELSSQWRAENPALITGENSAAALLKKIKDEREAIKRLPKPKRSAIKKKTGKRMSKQIIKVVEALTQAGEPLSGQQLLAAAGYPGDCNTDDLEKFFLDIRQALIVEKSIVKLERSEDGQDWFSLAVVGSNE